MTREQKASAAFGSVVAVGLLLVVIWSVPGGLLLLAIGVAVVVAGLRLTHPKGSRRPTARSLGLLGGSPAPVRPPTDEELAARKVALERRRLEQERRAIEREERRRQQQEAREERRREREEAAARRAAERAERARVEQERQVEAEQHRTDEEGEEGAPGEHETAILAASERAALPSAAGDGDLDDAQRQRVHLLDEVRLRLLEYE